MCLITTDPGALLATLLCVIKITDDEEPYMPLVHIGRRRGGRESSHKHTGLIICTTTGTAGAQHFGEDTGLIEICLATGSRLSIHPRKGRPGAVVAPTQHRQLTVGAGPNSESPVLFPDPPDYPEPFHTFTAMLTPAGDPLRHGSERVHRW